MKRRDILLGSGGLAAALLAGRVPTAQARTYTRQEETPSTAIELLPAESELDYEFVQLIYTNLDEIDDAEELTFGSSIIDRIEDLSVSAVDSVVTAVRNEGGSLSGVSGSFEQIELGETVRDEGDWRISHDEDDDLTVSSTSGLLVAAAGGETESRVGRVETATAVARTGGPTALDSLDLFEEAIDYLGEKRVVYFIPDVDDVFSGSIPEEIETLGAGFEKPPAKVRGLDGTLENRFFLEESTDADLDRDAVEEIIQDLEQGNVLEFDIQFDSDLVFVETVTEAPPERSRDASPDATISIEANPDEGTAVLEHRSGEAISTTDLELWVNGTKADKQLYQEHSTFEPGDTVTVETGPIANVYLRWIDEEANEHFEYVDEVVGTDAFDLSYDFASETLEMTYTATMVADTALLSLTRRSQVTENGQRRYEYDDLTAPLDAVGERLTGGDTIRVEDVQIEDRVTLDLDIPSRPAGTFGPTTTVVSYRVRPPRFRVSRQPNEQPLARYYDETPRDADSFQILVDGERADVQPSDQHDTLEQGDEVELGEQEFGSKIVIEWVNDDGSFIVDEHVVKPFIHFDATYDDEDGTITVEHLDGEAVESGAIELLFDGDRAPTQPADTDDVFEPGDTLTADAEPFTQVELRYVDDGVELMLGQTITGEDLFTASYDPESEALELTYTGSQSVDPAELSVQRFGTGQPGAEVERLFDEAYDTLTGGESVSIEDVAPGTVVRLVQTGEEVRQQVIAHFRATPQYQFNFETQDGTLVIEYTGRVSHDAAEFRVLADGTETETQPVDEHDVIEQGDTVPLGSFAPGTAIVIEWPTSTEPREIDRHVVTPTASFDAEYDESEGIVRVEHTGGDEIDAADLGIYAPPTTEELVRWGEDGTVSEGDSTVIEAPEKPDVVLVVYREQETIAKIPVQSNFGGI